MHILFNIPEKPGFEKAVLTTLLGYYQRGLNLPDKIIPAPGPDPHYFHYFPGERLSVPDFG